MIFDNHRFYVGTFKNFQFHGLGKYGIQDIKTKEWKFYEGNWNQGELISSKNKTAQGFKQKIIDVVTKREKSEIELDLIKTFAKPLIKEVPATVSSKWKQLRPFKISKAIDQGYLKIDKQYGVGSSIT